MPERITTSLLSPGCASHRQDGLLLRRHTSPDGIVITDIGSAAGFNSHRPYRPTRLRSIRLQRRPAPHRARPSPCGTSLNPHAFRDITVPMIAMGYTIIVAAGDDGAYANCSSLSIDYPASDPAVIAAGGTTLNLNAADRSTDDRHPGVVFWDLDVNGHAPG